MSESAEMRRSQVVGKAIAYMMAKVVRAEPSTVVSELDRCRKELLEAAETDWEREEIRRRIAEAKISVLWESSDRDRFMSSWSEIERLGYSSPEREASMLFYFLEFSARNGGSEEACKAELDRLSSLAKTLPPPAGAHFQGAYERAHARLADNAA